MPTTYREIPALPVVVALAVLAFSVMLWRLRRRAALNVPRVAVSLALCVYGAGMLANSVLPIYLGRPGGDVPWSLFVNIVPFRNTETADMLGNVAVFAPLGCALPIVLRATSARRVLLLGFLVSLTMEVLQLANAITVHGGHVADVNDLLANTVGALVGYGAFRAVQFVPVVGRWAAAATWPPSPPGHPDTRSTRVGQ